MPRKNFKNKRGINKALPEDKVKNKPFTIKFTPPEMERIEQVCKQLDMERTAWSRKLILDDLARLEELIKQRKALLPSDDVVQPGDEPGGTKDDLSIRQRADILGLQHLFPVEEIARRVGVTLEQVRAVLGQKKNAD